MSQQSVRYELALRHARRVVKRYGDRSEAILVDSTYMRLFYIVDTYYPGWDKE